MCGQLSAPSDSWDVLLLPFLQAVDQKQTSRLLDHLITQYADPIISGILRQKWQASPSPHSIRPQHQGELDAQDVRGETIAAVLMRLHDCKAGPDRKAITDFRAYVAVAAYHACTHKLRDKRPRRYSLQTRIDYLLTHEPQFACWRADGNRRLCGLAAWRSCAPSFVATPRLRLQGQRPPMVFSELPTGNIPTLTAVKALLLQLFTWIGQPVEVDEVVRQLALLCGVTDSTPCGIGSPGAEPEALSAPVDTAASVGTNVETMVVRRAYLATLWGEICALPPLQRSALLLNLRDTQGGDMLSLFPSLGVATRAQIAAALCLSPAELAALWPRLPLPDAEIARRWRLTRQQVICLRDSARKRLTRRMQKQ